MRLRKEDGQEVRYPAVNVQDALAAACAMIRDGLDVIEIVSADGTRIEARVIRELRGF